MKKKSQKDNNRNSNSFSGQQKFILFGLIVAVLATVAVAVITFINVMGNAGAPTQGDAAKITVPDIPIALVPTAIPTPSQEIDYPEPEYAFAEEEITVTIPGISKEYTIAWVSDAHILTDTEASDDVLEDQLETIQTRHDLAFVDIYGTPSDQVWPEVIKYLNYHHFDAVIFGGDLLDYASEKNIAYVSEYFNQLREDVPILYIRADHDYGDWYSGGAKTEADYIALHEQSFKDEDSADLKMLDFGEFKIIGINRSTKDMPDWQLNWFMNRYQSCLDEGTPVIIATHVPYESHIEEEERELNALSYEIRNKTYYWGGGDYVPGPVTQQFFDLIYADDTVVTQVLAGHLHASWDGMLTQKVSEHIFTPAYSGSIGIIHIVPGEESDGE